MGRAWALIFILVAKIITDKLSDQHSSDLAFRNTSRSIYECWTTSDPNKRTVPILSSLSACAPLDFNKVPSFLSSPDLLCWPVGRLTQWRLIALRHCRRAYRYWRPLALIYCLIYPGGGESAAIKSLCAPPAPSSAQSSVTTAPTKGTPGARSGPIDSIAEEILDRADVLRSMVCEADTMLTR